MKFIFIALTAFLLSACASKTYAPLPTVEKVDLNRYLGDWYQVAYIPNRFQAQCISDTKANYSLQSTWTGDTIAVRNSCKNQKGELETAMGVAKVIENSQNTKLKVSFFRPFYGNYWVLDLAPNYEWVLVGEPSREYGWILARKPNLEAATQAAILAKAKSLGYAPEHFVTSPHTP